VIGAISTFAFSFYSGELSMLRNMTIAPKLGILVGATMLGLCATCGIAFVLMQQEMFNARVDQTKAIVSMAKNMAGELKRQADAGERSRRSSCIANSAMP
jgi:methyl-accepting chemotaxis protein